MRVLISRYLATQRALLSQPVRVQTGRRLSSAEMFKPDEIKALVSERLTAAAEEIFSIFEQTIKEYEEIAFRSKQEIDQQRGLDGWKGNGSEINLNLKTAPRLRVLFRIAFVKRHWNLQSYGPLPKYSLCYYLDTSSAIMRPRKEEGDAKWQSLAHNGCLYGRLPFRNCCFNFTVTSLPSDRLEKINECG